MADDHPSGLTAEQLAALVQETGATREQIEQIVKLVGTSRSSIIFHARRLAKQQKT